MCCVAQEGSEEEGDTEIEKKIVAEEETQVTAKEKLEEINLGTEL